MKLTPEIMADHYAFLAKCVPFRDAGVPPVSQITFKTTKNKKYRGYFRALEKGFTIAISEEHNRHVGEVQKTMAHEMVHAHQQLKCPNSRHHGKEFKRLADAVCKYFCWGKEEF